MKTTKGFDQSSVESFATCLDVDSKGEMEKEHLCYFVLQELVATKASLPFHQGWGI